MDEWDNYIETLARITTAKERYNRLVGQIALEVRQKSGVDALKMLVEDVKERHGIPFSWKTLLNYAWIEEKTKDLAIPEDVTFKTRQAIAGAFDPQKYVDLLLQGVSSAEIYRMIRGDRRAPSELH